MKQFLPFEHFPFPSSYDFPSPSGTNLHFIDFFVSLLHGPFREVPPFSPPLAKREGGTTAGPNHGV